MSTGCKLQKVQGKNTAGFHTRDVSEGFDEVFPIFVRIVDDQWATALAVTAATEFAFAGAKFAGFIDFGNVWAGTNSFEELNGRFSFGDREAVGGDDEGDFGDGGDAVAAGLEERWDRGGGESGGCGEASATGKLCGIWELDADG